MEHKRKCEKFKCMLISCITCLYNYKLLTLVVAVLPGMSMQTRALQSIKFIYVKLMQSATNGNSKILSGGYASGVVSPFKVFI